MHLERFWKSLKYARLDPGMTIDEMEEATIELARRNDAVRKPGDDCMISQIVTRGEADGRDAPIKPNVVIWPEPLQWLNYANAWRDGTRVVIPKTRSYTSDQLDPKVKHYSRMNMIIAGHDARDIDPNAMALMLDMDGNISEIPGANFFIVTDGVLRTPTDKSCLAGIGRMNVMNLAQQQGIPLLVEDIQPYDVYTADEAFLTSTPPCMMPVGKADNRQIGDGVPGPVTKQLVDAWSKEANFDILGQIEQLEKTILASR